MGKRVAAVVAVAVALVETPAADAKRTTTYTLPGVTDSFRPAQAPEHSRCANAKPRLGSPT
jgi:hypothetical protein